MLYGYAGEDELWGGLGKDELYGGADKDDLHGDAEWIDGTLTISDVGDDDILHGGGGHDQLSGHGGDDELYGGAGDDWLEGGPGNDYLVDQWRSRDTFVFAPGHGNDRIVEFDFGIDMIDLSAFSVITNFDDLTLSEWDCGVLIDLTEWRGGTIRIGHGRPCPLSIRPRIEDLNASDFIFVTD